jgi:hypothetical protein
MGLLATEKPASSPPRYLESNVATLTKDEYRVALWVNEMRRRENVGVVDQGADRDCRELEAMAAELAAAKLFNVFPDFQWHDRNHEDLFILGQPVDIKLCNDYGINIRWNDKKQNVPDYFVFVAMYPLSERSFAFVGGIARRDLRDEWLRKGKDGCPFYTVPTDFLTWRPYGKPVSCQCRGN